MHHRQASPQRAHVALKIRAGEVGPAAEYHLDAVLSILVRHELLANGTEAECCRHELEYTSVWGHNCGVADLFLFQGETCLCGAGGICEEECVRGFRYQYANTNLIVLTGAALPRTLVSSSLRVDFAVTNNFHIDSHWESTEFPKCYVYEPRDIPQSADDLNIPSITTSYIILLRKF